MQSERPVEAGLAQSVVSRAVAREVDDVAALELLRAVADPVQEADAALFFDPVGPIEKRCSDGRIVGTVYADCAAAVADDRDGTGRIRCQHLDGGQRLRLRIATARQSTPEVHDGLSECS
ncbi:hypothetical protein ACM43_09940 [Bradyrhizobium sp. CCBAU 45321]|nr:hypothetical protein [Bradyrhizobium sp. CCBAU 45321]